MSPTVARTRGIGAAALALSMACLSCSSATDANGDGEDHRVTVSVASTSPLTLRPGQTTSLRVDITRQGFDKPVTLGAWRECQDLDRTTTCQPLPAGVTATFSPSTLSGDVLSSIVTIAVAPSTPAMASVGLLIRASGSGGAWSGYFFFAVDQPAVSVTLNGTGSGTVTSNPAGINCGNTCAGRFEVGTSVTLTATPGTASAFTGWSGGCSGASPTCVLVLTQVTTAGATFTNTTPGFSLALASTLLSVAQGASGSLAVTITRNNGFAAPVQLSVSGGPAGTTIIPDPATVTGTSSALNVVVASSVAVGNYPITITATSAGVATQTVTLNLAVTSAPGGSGSIAVSFATCDPSQYPIWVAVQSGNGAWTQVPAGPNHTFTFTIGAAGGIALVNQAGSGFNTTVRYGTHAELAAMAVGGVCLANEQTGTKQLTGTVASIAAPGTPQYYAIALGGVYDQHDISDGAAFTLENVASGARDLVATRVGINTANQATSLQRMIVRRGTDYPGNSAIPRLDFTGSESFVPVVINVAVSNQGADAFGASVALMTEFGLSAPYYNWPISTAFMGARYFALPASALLPGDFHVVSFLATPTPENPTSMRFIAEMVHAPAAESVTFGPSMNPVTVTSLGATTPLRLSARVAAQAEYNAAVGADYRQPDRSVGILTTATYFGGTPATWTLDIPDLSAAGYDASWGLRNGTGLDWTAVVVGGNVLPFFGAPPADGARIVGAQAGSTGASFAPLRSIAGH